MFTNKGYCIFSGYHPFPGSEWFHGLWWTNLKRTCNPERILTISDGYSIDLPFEKDGTWIHAPGDLGCCGDLLRREKHHFLPGVAAMWMLGLWYCYMAERDAIYVEQDVLIFGHWIERLYAELGPKSVIVGTAKTHGIATSIFMVRHHYIPIFIRDYLLEGPEDHPNRIPELKVSRMEQRNPEEFCRYSFPYDTDRPIDYSRDLWFGQKFTPAELKEMSMRGLISVEGMPDNVKLFSNR